MDRFTISSQFFHAIHIFKQTYCVRYYNGVAIFPFEPFYKNPFRCTQGKQCAPSSKDFKAFN